jgi:NitT/TauT family transport system ATP-binding protein
MAKAGEAKMSGRIEVRGLCVSYGNMQILQGLDLEVRTGEFVAVVGQSGCGKSTLLYALAGFVERRGEVRMPDGFGMVFQNYAVFPWLTVESNVAFGLRAIATSQRKAVVSRFLAIADLTNVAHHYPGQLSGGQAQRVAIARALAVNPDVIFMDEPFGALDTYTREKMQTWLLDIWDKERKTIVFVTHNIEEAVFLSDRVLVLGRGKFLSEFAVNFDRPRSEDLKFTPAFAQLEKHIVNSIKSQ